MSDLLSQMARASRQRADAARQAHPQATLPLSAPLRPLVHRGFELIAEVKLRAPSSGRLAPPDIGLPRIIAQAQAYARAGAAAISVLTEPDRFDGDLSHLRAVAQAVEIPVMRKDFLVDPYQVYEARAAGASGVLLITRMLDDEGLSALLDAAATLQMFTLVECFDAEDCQRTRAALQGRAQIAWVGVNTRDLRTLQVVPRRLEELVERLPADRVRVAESGLRSPEDVRAAADLGYRAALVGSALMDAADPQQAAAAMIASGRGAR